ncbi:hypothetical protein [Chryseobacterium koreense]
MKTAREATPADAVSAAGNSGCYRKLMRGLNDALLAGKACEFWQNFKLDNCMITIRCKRNTPMRNSCNIFPINFIAIFR